MESTLLRYATRARLPEMVILIRSQCAVICAQCGDFDTALRKGLTEQAIGLCLQPPLNRPSLPR